MSDNIFPDKNIPAPAVDSIIVSDAIFNGAHAPLILASIVITFEQLSLLDYVNVFSNDPVSVNNGTLPNVIVPYGSVVAPAN